MEVLRCLTVLLAGFLGMGMAQYPCILKRADVLGADILTSIVHKSQVAFGLLGSNDITFFCPSNDAFNKLPASIWKRLNTNTTFLTEVLSYHVIRKSYLVSELPDDGLLPSALAGHSIRTNTYNNTGGKVVYTAAGRPVMIADNDATNGMLHLMDTLLYPFPQSSALEFLQKNSEDFGSLYRLVEFAGMDLEKILSGRNPVTFLAPTDAAIRKLPPGALYYWRHNVTALHETLRLHLISGTLFTAGMTQNTTVTSLQGARLQFQGATAGSIRIKVVGGGLTTATLEMPDVQITNGVVHGIDHVFLLPKPPRQRGSHD